MRLTPSDPDIQTLIARIESKDMDLQPDFQRGEVWSLQKKKRLIDSILRDWHVPPIHVVVTDDNKQEVLDGQQRLAAIRDFAHDDFTIDGYTEPFDEEIVQLHQLNYSTLPVKYKRRFDGFTIRLFRITDYDPSEPGELFFRLNQPTNLTSAEQRNAFFGPVREQIKRIVEYLDSNGVDADFFGFSNARMAYDDIFAKLAISIESGTLREKVTAATITDRYRSNTPLSDETVHELYSCADILVKVKLSAESRFKYNKATVFSWLFFFVELRLWNSFPIEHLSHDIASFMSEFEVLRNQAKKGLLGLFLPISSFDISKERMTELLAIYNDRSSSRVGDVSSILIRDFITWFFFSKHLRYRCVIRHDKAHRLWSASDLFEKGLPTDYVVSSIIEETGWGRL